MSFLLNESITYWLSKMAASLQEGFNRDLEAFDITWPQWMVLNVLHHAEGNTPAFIAEQIGVDRSAITRLVDRLERKGLVVREHDKEDRRSVKVLITQPGKMILDMMDKAAADHQQWILARLGEGESQLLMQLVRKFFAAERQEQ